MKLIKIIILILPMFFIYSTCSDTVENKRTDSQENKALEQLCSGEVLTMLIEKEKWGVFREYVCMCQQASGKVGSQNLCKSIVNNNDSKSELNTCANLDKIIKGFRQVCFDTFKRIK